MKINVKIDNILFSFITFYHILYLILSAINPEGNLTNRLALIYFAILYCYFLKYNKRNIISFVLANIVFLVYVIYTVDNYHIFQMLHSDFYSFVLLCFQLIVFTNTDVLNQLLNFLYRHKGGYLKSLILFFIIILINIIFYNGLHVGFGSSIPILYGPSSAPHVLGYSLIGIYLCIALIGKIYSNKLLILLIKILSVFAIVWTASRTAVLVIVLIIMADYLSIDKISKKIVVALAAVIVSSYFIMFTNIGMNNPLTQKTLSAIENGSITNGRERFVWILMSYFNKETTAIEKFLGIGMQNVRNIMLKNRTIGVAIHAHNDYVNAICGYGILGLIIYILLQIKTLKIPYKLINKILLGLSLFILSYYNGLAMYTVFTPIIGYLFLFFRGVNSTKNNGEQDK